MTFGGNPVEITVEFAPTEAGQEYTGTITFTTDAPGQDDIVINLRGASATEAKAFNFFGCAPGTLSGNGWVADITVLLLALLALGGAGRLQRVRVRKD